MSPDKLLGKIQQQINDLAPSLELFVEDTIQPSVKDCEDLQKKLALLQENVAVYKYNKQEKEISPSFNIHAKVSEKEIVAEKKQEPVVEEKKIQESLVDVYKTEPVIQKKEEQPVIQKTISSLVVGINDKFRFINELFKQNNAEYNIAIEQLNSVVSWHEAEVYLDSLKSVYGWKDEAEVTKQFYSTVKKRFA